MDQYLLNFLLSKGTENRLGQPSLLKLDIRAHFPWGGSPTINKFRRRSRIHYFCLCLKCQLIDLSTQQFLGKRINIGKLLLSWNNGLLNACYFFHFIERKMDQNQGKDLGRWITEVGIKPNIVVENTRVLTEFWIKSLERSCPPLEI